MPAWSRAIDNNQVTDIRKGVEEPEWVIQNSWTDKPLKRRQKIQYLLLDSQNRVNDTEPVFYYRFVERPLTVDGVETLSKFEVSFNPVYQTLVIHKLMVTRNGETQNRLNDTQIQILQQEEDADQNIYDGFSTAVLILSDIRRNDIIDISYSLTGTNPVLGDKYFSYKGMGWTVGIDKRAVRYVVPEDRTIAYRAHNFDHRPSITKLASGDDQYLWVLENTSALNDDRQYPPGDSPFPWLEVSEYKSWAEVVEWAMALYQDKYQGGKAFQKLVEKLDQQSAGDQKKYASLALNYVQEEIRYLGLEFGENSHRPSTPDEVLQNRYGDCKDKSVLLTALMRAKGIKAWPALVSSDERGGIANMLPSPGAFNHVITLIDLDGVQYWVDATRNYQGTDIDTVAITNFGKALVLREGEYRLSKVITRHRNDLDLTETLVAESYDSPVEMTVTSIYQGQAAEWQRSKLDNEDLEQIERDYLDYMARRYPYIESAGAIKVQDDKKANRVTLTEYYRIPEYWEVKNNDRIAPFYTTNFYSDAVKPKRLKRNGPYWPGSKVSLTHKTQLSFPEPVELDLDGWNQLIRNEYFMYQTGATYKGKTLTVDSFMSLEGKSVPAKDIPRYVKNMGKVIDLLDFNLTFEDPAPEQRTRESLLSRLERKVSEALGEE
ncbi:DUF3857 domain-containing protein [Sansalvadorimonas sp. 2012CJ34-2]|uniref:DUF3857 domain-containing protein n=1 Tax=Parendozoicomonas callyspongiae TaxID=2942213 RepID=A0ABT0PGB8_9GAMM|nr:DUF3857 domain-containing protein [Sansalvadorimonas sp. 2012CJ34-2]MCL6270404.1 DUF3857 domain-containing protein [Sansalvadorimonas sp. 2012CJ34-2]